jgi:sulfonate transport system permease protein
MARLARNGAVVHHSVISLRRLSIGVAVGTTLAILIGTLVGVSLTLERVLGPTVSLLAPIPVPAWIPIIIILVGIGEGAKYSVIAVGVFFVVYFGTVNGIRSTDPKLVEVARICGKSSAILISQVLLPSALASIVQSIRGALGFGWVLLVVAEVIASTEGVGWLIWDARQFGRADDMMVGVIIAGILGAATDWLARHGQRRLLTWRPAFQGQ